MSRCIDFGIDLGTTNSCIAAWEGGSTRVFTNRDQMNVTPSVVCITARGRLIVGQRAYLAAVEDGENVADGFKRLMGGSDRKAFPASKRSLSPEELSAEVLKSLLEDVQRLTGKHLETAVITVPAAFGTKQCEATARAGRLAGLKDVVLLQEPIAGAVGYGVAPGHSDQKWMVFDLGGGTLDVAIVSTRNGQLVVLEHRGNNWLGGRDIDMKLVDSIVLPELRSNFSVPSAAKDGESFQRLMKRLLFKAEAAKIELSTRPVATMDLEDLGEDLNHRPMEGEVRIERRDLERLVEPVVDKAVCLAEETLQAARLSGSDLDRVLLVGGPTQMPVIREAISSRLGARLDCSFDPMTIVARGAAIYASTIELSGSASAIPATEGNLSLQLAYDRISSNLQTTVGGKLLLEGLPFDGEARVDSKGGFWTSGWVPLRDGVFEVQVTLQEGTENRFQVQARGPLGRLEAVEPGDFSIRHGLVIGSPPLPHSVSIEVRRPDGRVELDPVFERGTLLPAEKEVRYRADHELKPADSGSYLAIKVWEGEQFRDPLANVWVGNLKIRSEEIQRTLPQGAEIYLLLKIDPSRQIKVTATIPHLNQSFSHDVYVPDQDLLNYQEKAQEVPKEIERYSRRLNRLEEGASVGLDGDLYREIGRLRAQVDDLQEMAQPIPEAGQTSDPDQARRVAEADLEVRTRIDRLETRLGISGVLESAVAEGEDAARLAQEVIDKFGVEADRKELEALRRDLEHASQKKDERGIRKTTESIERLRWRILVSQDEFWYAVFEGMKEPDRSFSDHSAADQWIQRGERAAEARDVRSLRDAVTHLWELMPKAEAAAAQERGLRSGLLKR